jgi:hypothetical protein
MQGGVEDPSLRGGGRNSGHKINQINKSDTPNLLALCMLSQKPRAASHPSSQPLYGVHTTTQP